jgi:hypothetical protein
LLRRLAFGYKGRTMRSSGRRRLGTVLLGAGLAGIAVMLLLRGDDRARREAPEAPGPVAAPAPAPEAGSPPSEPPGPLAPAAPDPFDGLAAGEGAGWTQVDLEEVRRALPDNLYWQTSVPTEDLRELDRRAEERARWNEAYGKVLSNTATEQEIEAYYAHRQRVSEDAIEFANHLLNRYEDVLPPRDVGLLELAIELHLARLEEIPRQITDAQRRREVHEAARQAWLEEQAAFEDDASVP